MSIKVLNDVWEHSKASGTPLLVILSLADWADPNGECWPSIDSIRVKCRLKDNRHVKRVIHEVLDKQLGEVEVVTNAGKSNRHGGMRSNLYRITVQMDDSTVADEPPLHEVHSGHTTTPDSGSGTTPDSGSGTTQIVADEPPEPSLTHQSDPSGRSVDLSLVVVDDLRARGTTSSPPNIQDDELSPSERQRHRAEFGQFTKSFGKVGVF